MPDRNRCMFEASVARVIWSLRLNPVHILQALNADKERIRQLPMPARYHCYKNIQSFFEKHLSDTCPTIEELMLSYEDKADEEKRKRTIL